MLKSERNFLAIGRSNNRDELVVRLRAAGARQCYSWFLGYTVKRGFKIGYASVCFKEVWGVWPWEWSREYRDIEPSVSPDCLVELWAASRPKRTIKKPKPAPLVDQAHAAEAVERARVVNENGFVPGTYMTPEDFEVSWR